MRARSLIAGAGSAVVLSTIFLGIHKDLVTQAASLLIAGLLAIASGSPAAFLAGLLVVCNTALVREASVLTVLSAYIAPYLVSVAVIAKFWRIPFSLRGVGVWRAHLASALICVGASLVTLGSIYVLGADQALTVISPYGSPEQLLSVLVLSAVVGVSLSNSGLVIAFLAGLVVPLFSPLSVLIASAGPHRLVEIAEGGVVVGELTGIIEEGGVRETKGHAALDFSGAGNHTVIIGATGTGKSRLIKSIAKGLRSRGYGVVLIDTHGEHSEIDGSISLTPREIRLDLASGGKQEIDDITDIISEAFRLGPLQRAVLHEAMTNVYERNNGSLSLNDVVEELSSEPSTPVKRSLTSYLRSLSKYFSESGVGVQELLKPGAIHVIDISGLGHITARVFADILLRSIIYSAMRRPSGVVVIVEEAHRFIGGRATALGRLFREGRKFGITAVITTQSPTDLPSDVYVNSRYIISFSVTDARGANYLAQTISGGSRATYVGVRKVLTRLKRGEALLWDRESDHIYILRTF